MFSIAVLVAAMLFTSPTTTISNTLPNASIQSEVTVEGEKGAEELDEVKK